MVLSQIGDPDLTVVQRGAERHDVESEVGSPDASTDDGSMTRAVYNIRLGKRPDPDSALRKAGLSTSRAMAAGAAASKTFAHTATHTIGLGPHFSATLGTGFGVAVGGAYLVTTDALGTIRQIVRLVNRRRHRLVVWYDTAGRVRQHKLERVRRNGKFGPHAPPGQVGPHADDLRRRWKAALRRRQG